MISMQEAIKRYTTLKMVEQAVGTVEEIAKEAGTTRQMLNYHWRKQVSKDNAPAPESSAGHISPLPDTDKHAPSDEGSSSLPRRTA